MTDFPVDHAAYRRAIHKHANDGLSQVEIEDLWKARIPVEYVNALQPAYASNIIEYHGAGVPADYASAFSAKWRQQEGHIVAFYAEHVPVEYATAIVDHRGYHAVLTFFREGIEADYVRAIASTIPASDIIAGHRSGVAPEYLLAVLT